MAIHSSILAWRIPGMEEPGGLLSMGYSNGRLDFPGPTQVETCIPRRNSRILPQLEKKHVGPPSVLDEALAHYSVSREVPG